MTAGHLPGSVPFSNFVKAQVRAAQDVLSHHGTTGGGGGNNEGQRYAPGNGA